MKNKDLMNQPENDKTKSLEKFKATDKNAALTTNVGIPVEEDDFILKAGERGPALIQDFQFLQKILHFTKERIPERVVHARGTGVHGEFELYESMEKYTYADFLQRPGEKTPVFTRFSTFQGSKGSPDTVRDIRGFSIKFYTQQGNFDLTALSFPVFFIHDPMKFPDLVHSAKPEPRDEIPQAQTAHDNFWDFVSQNQETAHAVMWLMSDRGIPKSFRTMGGFGINTYKWINKQGETFFVKYHLKPLLGVHSFVWDECQKIAGKDPDFHRRDIMEAIDRGEYPQWEFGVQILPEKDEFMFDFDILDDTKLWPEELAPVTPIGRLTLNKNVDNFFSETEQSTFNPSNLVPGMDISNDPILQGRMVAYMDTQMHRLGGPNFNQIPINQPVSPVHNYQRDGFHQMNVFTDKVNYIKNSQPHGLHLSSMKEGGFHFAMEKVQGEKLKGRPTSFTDFFSQPKMLFNSLQPIEKKHLIQAFQFELSKVREQRIQQNVVNMFAHVDQAMAQEIASYLGLTASPSTPIKNVGQGGKEKYTYQGKSVSQSAFLSQEKTVKTAKGLKLAVLVTAKTNISEIQPIVQDMEKEGVVIVWVGETLGQLTTGIHLNSTLYTTYPVLYDGILLTSMEGMKQENMPFLDNFINETFNHYKPILFTHQGDKHLMDKHLGEPGVVSISQGQEGIGVMAQMRFWDRNFSK